MKALSLLFLLFSANAYAERYYCYSPSADGKVLFISQVFFSTNTSFDVQSSFSAALSRAGVSNGQTLCPSQTGSGDAFSDREHLISTLRSRGVAVQEVSFSE